MPYEFGGYIPFGRIYTSDGTEINPGGSIPSLTNMTNECFLSNAEIERIKTHINNQPQVKRIIFHDPATIVFWQDGTKTVVKCMPGQPFSTYYGFVCALAKKVYGSNSAVERIVKQYREE